MRALGLNAAVARAFRRLHERWIVSPWAEPGGTSMAMLIRPHDDPEYQRALKASGLRPKTIQERAREVVDAAQRPESDTEGSAKVYTNEDYEREMMEINRAGFDWQAFPAAYSLAECAAVADLVQRHLVVEVRALAKGQAPEEGEPASEQEVAELFASPLRLPHALPSEPTNGSTEIAPADVAAAWRAARGSRERVYLGGEPEGAAITAYVLVESLRDEKFLERLAPLESASGSMPDDEATTTRKRGLPPASAPISQPSDGAATTPSAPAHR